MAALWDFLRDEQNQKALALLGGAVTAVAFALWTLWRERGTARDLATLRREVEAQQADIANLMAAQQAVIRRLENSDRPNQIVILSPTRGIPRGRPPRNRP